MYVLLLKLQSYNITCNSNNYVNWPVHMSIYSLREWELESNVTIIIDTFIIITIIFMYMEYLISIAQVITLQLPLPKTGVY